MHPPDSENDPSLTASTTTRAPKSPLTPPRSPLPYIRFSLRNAVKRVKQAKGEVEGPARPERNVLMDLPLRFSSL
nr:hypothetical protein CFP56_03661 [Quercus suber]